jgi:hypothetical protein
MVRSPIGQAGIAGCPDGCDQRVIIPGVVLAGFAAIDLPAGGRGATAQKENEGQIQQKLHFRSSIP